MAVTPIVPQSLNLPSSVEEEMSIIRTTALVFLYSLNSGLNSFTFLLFFITSLHISRSKQIQGLPPVLYLISSTELGSKSANLMSFQFRIYFGLHQQISVLNCIDMEYSFRYRNDLLQLECAKVPPWFHIMPHIFRNNSIPLH